MKALKATWTSNKGSGSEDLSINSLKLTYKCKRTPVVKILFAIWDLEQFTIYYRNIHIINGFVNM